MVTPSIDQFIVAAQQLKNPHDELIVQDGAVYPLSEKYSDEPMEFIRQRTWQAFRKAIETIFPPHRLQRICIAYGFPWEKMTNSSLPLSRRHIEIFGVGSATIHVDDLLPQSADPSSLTPEEIRPLYMQADRMRYIGPTESAKNFKPGPRALHEYVIMTKFDRARRGVILREGIEKLRAHPHSFYQRFTMGLPGTELPDGIIIPAPSEEEGKIDYYKKIRTVAARGLYADAFVPVSKYSKLRPVLVFRATRTGVSDVDFFHSLRNNAELNIGATAYLAAKPQLDALVKDTAFRRFFFDPFFGGRFERFDVCAYSQGDGYAAHFIRDYWPHINEVVSFGGVSNSSELAEDFAEKMNAREEDDPRPPSFYIYRAVTDDEGKKGDWATFLGEKHIGWGCKDVYVRVDRFKITELPTPTNIKEWGDLHSLRYLDGEENPYEKYEVTTLIGEDLINEELDNLQRGEEVRRFEELRRSLGTKILYYVLDIVYRFVDFFLRFFGVQLLRSS